MENRLMPMYAWLSWMARQQPGAHPGATAASVEATPRHAGAMIC
jgi:hypothetical protein